MKRSRWYVLLLAVCLLIASTGMSSAENYKPHAEKIVELDGKLYGLVSYMSSSSSYAASEVVEFDAELSPKRVVRLVDGTNKARNACYLTVHGSKLYVAAMGGWQATDSFGDLWEVDPSGSDMTARRIADMSSHPYFGKQENAHLYGLAIASDGTVFVPVQSSGYTVPGDYSTYFSKGRIVVVSLSDLLAGKGLGDRYIDLPGNAYPLDAKWDETAQLLWVNHAGTLRAFNKDATEIPAAKKTPSDLGAVLYDMTLSDGVSGIVYAAVDYSGESAGAGSMGTVKKIGAAYPLTQTYSGATTTDLGVFSYKRSGVEQIMLLERDSMSSTRDRATIWNGTVNLTSAPDQNITLEAENIHGMTALGSDLYAAAYENPRDGNSGVGEFVRFDMSSSYKKTKSYELKELNESPASQKIDSKKMNFTKIVTDIELITDLKSTDVSGAAIALDKNDLQEIGGVVVVKEGSAARIAREMQIAGELDGDKVGAVNPLSAFKLTGLVSGSHAAVMYELIGSQLLASDPKLVKIIKVKSSSGNDVKIFEHASTEDEAMSKDGSYMIRTGEDYAAVTRIDPLKMYKLIIIVKDGGEFDLDGRSDGTVFDPAVIVKTSTSAPAGVGSGGGCSTGAMLSIALAVLAITKKR